MPKTWIKEGDFYIENFTSMSVMLETMEQSGFVTDDISPRELAVDVFKEDAVSLFVLDYLVEHDDRHWGNFGYLRDSNTGQYLGMAYYYDFDWAWSDAVIPLPQNALLNYYTRIQYLAKKAIQVSDEFEDNYRNIITKRAKELLNKNLDKEEDEFTSSNNF